MAHPLLTRVCAATAAIALVTLSAPLVAHAAAEGDNGTSLGELSITPSTGTWDQQDVSLDGNFSCPVVAGSSSAYLYAYITPVGSEAPATAAGENFGSGSLYPFVNATEIAQADGGSVDMVAITTTFPSDNGAWAVDAVSDPVQLRDELEIGSEYSLVVACAYSTDADPVLVPDASGHVAAAWTGFRVTADGWEATSTGGGGGGGGGGGENVTSGLGLTASATTSTTVTLSAAVTAAGGAAATDAAGSVEFFRGTDSLGTSVVGTGAATLDVTGLTPNTPYTFTAAFTPTSGSGYSAATSAALSVTTLAAGTDPVDTVLASGGVVSPGRNYRVEVPAGTFTAADTLAGVIQSDPITLAETATAGSDGSASYAFIAPSSLPAGQHTLTLTGTPSTFTYVVSFTVAAQVPAVTPVVAPAAVNKPFAALTDWVLAASSTPTGVTGLFAGILVLAAVALLGWRMIFTRRPTVNGSHNQT